MTMERRHFELIAEIIAKELDGEHREKAAYAFAHILLALIANASSWLARSRHSQGITNEHP